MKTFSRNSHVHGTIARGLAGCVVSIRGERERLATVALHSDATGLSEYHVFAPRTRKSVYTLPGPIMKSLEGSVGIAIVIDIEHDAGYRNVALTQLFADPAAERRIIHGHAFRDEKNAGS